ncbi:MoaD/ThiS family protein [Candidatus Woesearchaeota archaeon]|nr:MoaD/ThiS family protein [Candidatus Woesearchaeota archaeon]
MKVYIEKDDKELSMKATDAGRLLKKLGINPETALIIKNNELVTADEKLKETDEIKIISVISGG